MFFYSEYIYYYRCFIRNKSKNIETISLLNESYKHLRAHEKHEKSLFTLII